MDGAVGRQIQHLVVNLLKSPHQYLTGLPTKPPMGAEKGSKPFWDNLRPPKTLKTPSKKDENMAKQHKDLIQPEYDVTTRLEFNGNHRTIAALNPELEKLIREISHWQIKSDEKVQYLAILQGLVEKGNTDALSPKDKETEKRIKNLEERLGTQQEQIETLIKQTKMLPERRPNLPWPVICDQIRKLGAHTPWVDLPITPNELPNLRKHLARNLKRAGIDAQVRITLETYTEYKGDDAVEVETVKAFLRK